MSTHNLEAVCDVNATPSVTAPPRDLSPPPAVNVVAFTPRPRSVKRNAIVKPAPTSDVSASFVMMTTKTLDISVPVKMPELVTDVSEPLKMPGPVSDVSIEMPVTLRDVSELLKMPGLVPDVSIEMLVTLRDVSEVLKMQEPEPDVPLEMVEPVPNVSLAVSVPEPDVYFAMPEPVPDVSLAMPVPVLDLSASAPVELTVSLSGKSSNAQIVAEYQRAAAELPSDASLVQTFGCSNDGMDDTTNLCHHEEATAAMKSPAFPQPRDDDFVVTNMMDIGGHYVPPQPMDCKDYWNLCVCIFCCSVSGLICLVVFYMFVDHTNNPQRFTDAPNIDNTNTINAGPYIVGPKGQLILKSFQELYEI